MTSAADSSVAPTQGVYRSTATSKITGIIATLSGLEPTVITAAVATAVLDTSQALAVLQRAVRILTVSTAKGVPIGMPSPWI